MILDEDLLRYNKEGYIPGPNENEEDFLKRVDLSKKMFKDPIFFFKDQKKKPPFNLESRILKPRWNWTRAQLLNLFDVSPTNLALFYSDEDLHFFQAAATWIITMDDYIRIPILQFRKILNRKPYLFFYTLDEILAHESIHALRVAFEEPKTEEVFSYMTATSVFRKIFGPIVRHSRDIFIFFSLMILYFITQIFWVISSNTIFYYISSVIGLSTLCFLSFGLIRLFSVRRKCAKTFKKLNKILKNKTKARAVLFRLTDNEIFQFAKSKEEKISKYFDEKKQDSLRLKMIYLAYFK